MNNVPEGATHSGHGMWYRLAGDVLHFWAPNSEEWRVSDSTVQWARLHLNPLHGAVQPHDTVNNLKHYQLLPGVEVYDIRQALAAKATAVGATLDQFSDYDRAVEYLLRMWEKNGVEDAKKAAWYLNKLVEKLSDDRS